MQSPATVSQETRGGEQRFPADCPRAAGKRLLCHRCTPLRAANTVSAKATTDALLTPLRLRGLREPVQGEAGRPVPQRHEVWLGSPHATSRPQAWRAPRCPGGPLSRAGKGKGSQRRGMALGSSPSRLSGRAPRPEGRDRAGEAPQRGGAGPPASPGPAMARRCLRA